jgi:hypothetical protein
MEDDQKNAERPIIFVDLSTQDTRDDASGHPQKGRRYGGAKQNERRRCASGARRYRSFFFSG